jgi:hypothetical protein
MSFGLGNGFGLVGGFGDVFDDALSNGIDDGFGDGFGLGTGGMSRPECDRFMIGQAVSGCVAIRVSIVDFC